MQVGRALGGDLRRFRESRVAIAPVSSFGAAYQLPVKPLAKREDVRLDVIQHCGLCGRQSTAKTVGRLLCPGCRRLQRQSRLEDIRPASPMAGKPKALSPVKTNPSWTEVEGGPELADATFATFRTTEDADSFRSMEVLTCFRSQVRRGLRLLSKAATAEKWHVCWAVLLSMCLLPVVLTLMLVAGVGFLVLSTWVAIAAVIVYPLAYINPRVYNYAMDS
ncbi:hypothetical protein PHYPSEUDO_001053 [Phytophthora pseudosyringae]|uniref:Transmembrane protein n=1 Tax=Phytophthora pseudosyringae TaxID=221518 RepID=A0A8T1VZW6_9STRA|nr:hypothetical protein PHYPSEUDO_001053 [Phytophthora pseudosyringae]